MATITIRNLPDEVRDRLRVQAAENGRSMEAEARAMLEEHLDVRRALDDQERRRRIEAVQEAMEPYRSPDVLMSEELIAERRLEAWKETVESMQDLRKHGRIDLEAAVKRLKRARRRS
jgi:plasmid stability protein